MADGEGLEAVTMRRLANALGVAPMLGQAVGIRSCCHHCGEPLELSVDPFGAGLDTQDVMVWVGKRCEGERRVSTSL